MSALDLDELIFIPNRIHPFTEKREIIPAEYRLAMIRIAIRSFDRLFVDELELNRNDTSYAIDTIRHYLNRKSQSVLYYLIGSDNLASFDKWKDYQILPELVKFLVFKRTLFDNNSNKHPFNFQNLNNPVIEISSTDIRNRIKMNLPFKSMVPPGVYEYILENKLYSD